ncbi:hypothetical protein HK100_005974 [Physocladia obscura]|uniref:AB hydrolase-1 domain-containing protein n=1 Tax=Physocladia obscura TaxID=109957 RepID=A0AAD5XBY7_9FUNG|nr:hypothetical protein HK100_005974 [Physocladia obscura]
MANNDLPIIIPRPDTDRTALFSEESTSIAAPTESSFVSQFGTHLPPAQYLTQKHEHGNSSTNTAYYEFLPSTAPVSGLSAGRLLIVHGVGTPALGMFPLAKVIRESYPHFHIVLYDHFGHGLSSTPLVPHVPALFHAQIIALFDHLKWANAHLLGFSFGGSTVTSFTALHPHLVSSFTLVAPAGLISSDSFSEQEKRYLAGGPGVDENAARDWIVDWVSGGPLVVQPDWKDHFSRGEIISGDPIQVWERENHKGHIPSIVAMFRDGGACDMHEYFKIASNKSNIYKLAVIGELDSVCSEQDLKNVGFDHIIVVPKAGHSLVRNRVSEVASPIIEFLQKASAQ